MTTTTKRGDDLARKLESFAGWTREIAETCALIARHATTYARIQERWCSEEMSERTTKRLEEQEARLEKRLRDLVDSLPATDDGPLRVKFDGDPRGYTVRLVSPQPLPGWGTWADRHELGVA